MYFPASEGFYDFENSEYIYQYKYHLDRRGKSTAFPEGYERSSVRVNYTRNSAGVLQQLDTNDYYPFGLNFINPLVPVGVYSPSATYKNYKYNGKELQETGMYDYGARMYMPDIGRFGTQDALGEMYYSYSPYGYVANNPIKFIDPTGMWIDIKDGDNTYRYNNGKLYTQNAETQKWDVEATVTGDSYAGQILSAFPLIGKS